MTLWKVFCMENEFPGMWQRWFAHQAVGIGWPPEAGFRLTDKENYGRDWTTTRNALLQMRIGDYILVALSGNRVGRVGQITGKAINDDEWNPLVPPSQDYPSGEMGRRVLVRWDLIAGPPSRDQVVALPPNLRLNSGEARGTIRKVTSFSLQNLLMTMSDPANWVGLLTHFEYEKALSGYIAAYPHRLEDGLLPHPNEKVRERVFKDKTRLDVLLEDRFGVPVIVECKQGTPTIDNVKQLRGYLERLKNETGKKVRGILVHGGSKKLSIEVAEAAKITPRIEIVQYVLDVDFSLCS